MENFYLDFLNNILPILIQDFLNQKYKNQKVKLVNVSFSPFIGNNLEISFLKEELDNKKCYSYNNTVIDLYEIMLFVSKEYFYLKNKIETLQSEIVVKENMNF